MSTISIGCRLGPYELQNLIGRGGMGEVYRAQDSRLNRPVALKVLAPEFTTDSRRMARFLQEARLTARLNHPNILAVYDVGSHLGIPFVVSELLDGRTLRDHLKKRRLPLATAVRYGLDLARGLVAAHQLGIVHRDLKPENIFITRDDRLKILDFGVAKCRSAPAGSTRSAGLNRPGPMSSDNGTSVSTECGTLIGTVGYVSPEQARGEAVDPRSDIFSVGIVLYEMISGVAPFRGDSSVETLHAILKEEPIPLDDRGEGVPRDLDEVVHHCLEKDPERRFQSARDLAFSLELILGSLTRDQRLGTRRTADNRTSHHSPDSEFAISGVAARSSLSRPTLGATLGRTGLWVNLRGLVANGLVSLSRVFSPIS